MKTCPNCDSIPHHQLLRGASGESYEQAMAGYNDRLEKLRDDGYQWDPETLVMVKPCAECAASPEETRDETSSTEDPDPIDTEL